MAEDKPTAAFVVSLIGGIMILILGIIVGSFLASVFNFIGLTEIGVLCMVLSLIFGLLVILGAVLMYMKPESHVAGGVIVLLFSLFSIVVGGGYIIGMILGIVGGILGIVWKPSQPQVVMAAPMYQPPYQQPPPGK